MKLREFADNLQNKLISRGFTVQRYNAISSNSIYLKLDFGVAHSIRIANHHGKNHLHYRYNILTITNQFRVDNRGKYPRRYYTLNQMKRLVKDIVSERDNKIKRYGKTEYNQMCLYNKRTKSGTRGFWSEATLIGGEK